jgi:hypothetical protein
MFKYTIFFFILFFISSAVAQHPAVGLVRQQDGNGHAQGSGTIIAHHQTDPWSIVLTARHVVETQAPATFEIGGRKYPVVDIKRHPLPECDAAVVVVNGIPKTTPVIPAWPDKIRVGMPVWGEGYGSSEFGRTKGTVSGTFGVADFQCDLPSIPGDSGGVVLTVDEQRRPYVLGVISGSNWPDPGGPTWTAAVSIVWIRDWISQIKWSTSVCDALPSGGFLFRRILQGRQHPEPYSQQQSYCPPCNPQMQQQQPQYQIPDAQPEFVPTPPQLQPIPQPQPQYVPLPQQQYVPQQQLLPRQDNEWIQGRIRAEIDYDELVDRLAADPRFRGAAGKDGRDGKDGRPGRDGIDGAPGKDGMDGQDGMDAEVTPEQLSALGQALYAQMASDPTFRGPPGPPGEFDPGELDARIRAALPKIGVQINDGPIVTQDLKQGNALFQFRVGNEFRVREGSSR